MPYQQGRQQQWRRLFQWLLLLLCNRIGCSYIAHTRFPNNPLPLHLQTENPPREVTLRAAVLHSDPFAIVTENEDGELFVRGLQLDLVQRLIELAQEDGVKLKFELEPWKKSSEHGYSTALDLVANDCEERLEELPSDSIITQKYNCSSFDLIIGDFFSTSDRYLRVDMTPPWLSNAIATMKYVGNEKDRKIIEDDDENMRLTDGISTLTEASEAEATVCVQKDTPSSTVVMYKFPKARYLQCRDDEECFEFLSQDRCVLFAKNEMFLLQKDNENTDFEVTRERFNTQYMVWPMRYDLPAPTSYLLKRWIKRAIEETTMDELYHEYFAKKVCPIGTAGENCELPCDPDHGYSDRRSGKCICESTKYTGDDCSIEVEEDFNLIPYSFKAVCYGLFGVNAVAILFCALWLVRFRKSDQVRASQPFFLMLVLLGCFISSSTIIALAQEQDEGDGPFAPCAAIPWLYSIGFCFTFGTLFAKIRRVYLVFHQAIGKRNASATNYTVSRKEAVLISFQETLCIIGTVTLINAVILVAWTVADPLEWIRGITLADKYGRPLASQGYCTSEHIGLFAGLIGSLHLVLLATGCYLCYKARQIPTMFQEGKYVSLAMGSNLQIFLVGVPILLLETDPQTSFIVRSVIVWMNNLVVIVLIFGNLIYKTLRTSNSLSDSDVKGKISKAVNQYATNKGENSSGSPNNRSDLSFLNRDVQIDHEDEEEGKDTEDNEGNRALEAPNSAISRSRRSMISSISMDSTSKFAPTSQPLKKVSRNMISSISMDSQSGILESAAIASTVGLPTLPERSIASSISTGSCRLGRKKSSNRSVTFGMAYSECEDGSEIAMPLEPPRDDSPDPSSTKRRSLARFNSDSAKAAPPRVPKRGCFEALATNDGEQTTYDCDKTELSVERNRLSSSQTGPPHRPIRMDSNVSAGCGDKPSTCDVDPDCESSCSDQPAGCHQPCAKSAREKSAEDAEEPIRLEESCRSQTTTTEQSESTPQTSSTTKILHLSVATELLDASVPNNEPAAALLDTRRSPPQQPKRLPSGSTLSDVSRCSYDSDYSGPRENGGCLHPVPPLSFPSGKAA